MKRAQALELGGEAVTKRGVYLEFHRRLLESTRTTVRLAHPTRSAISSPLNLPLAASF
jgi:hypothetical protein